MELNNQQNSFNRKDFIIGFIYKIQNKINGKVYIGQTIHPLTRPYFHLENPNCTNKRFGSSIKHHGKENFEVKILCECYSKDDLNWAEIFYIVEWYDSIHKSRGYNLRTELQGTHHTQNLTEAEYKAYCDKMNNEIKQAFSEPILTEYKKSFHMMATKAYHKLGDISRDEPDLCIIQSETENCYVGAWVTGHGFFNVRFPKNNIRELTEKEIEYYEKLPLTAANINFGTIKIRRRTNE